MTTFTVRRNLSGRFSAEKDGGKFNPHESFERIIEACYYSMEWASYWQYSNDPETTFILGPWALSELADELKLTPSEPFVATRPQKSDHVERRRHVTAKGGAR